jgi:hypothetical protein
MDKIAAIERKVVNPVQHLEYGFNSKLAEVASKI